MYQYENQSKTNSKKSTADTSTISKSNEKIYAEMPVQLKSLFSQSFTHGNDGKKLSLNNISHPVQPMPLTYSPLQMQLMPKQEHGEVQQFPLKMTENQEKLAPIPAKPNNTGIPLQIKERFENLSGFSFDDVKVHYNSDKPAQLQALAYTQGNQVYVGLGQERHLGHELGHVVQQKQGIVKPTKYVNGMPVNDEHIMEQKANENAIQYKQENTDTSNVLQFQQVHHIIPHELRTNYKDVADLLRRIDFEFEDDANKVPLATHVGAHPHYTKLIAECIWLIRDELDFHGVLSNAMNKIRALLSGSGSTPNEIAQNSDGLIRACFGSGTHTPAAVRTRIGRVVNPPKQFDY